MPDDFNPFDFDPYIPSKEEQLLEQITDLRYTTEKQIDTIAQNQTNMLKYTKSVNDNLSNENKKDRKRSDKQFWLSLSIAILGVIIGVLGLVF